MAQEWKRPRFIVTSSRRYFSCTNKCKILRSDDHYKSLQLFSLPINSIPIQEESGGSLGESWSLAWTQTPTDLLIWTNYTCTSLQKHKQPPWISCLLNAKVRFWRNCPLLKHVFGWGGGTEVPISSPYFCKNVFLCSQQFFLKVFSNEEMWSFKTLGWHVGLIEIRGK